MFESKSDFDEQSGLLHSGKRYNRNLGSYTLGQNTEYTPLSLEELESQETSFVRNPPLTPHHRSVTPENPSQSESHPSLSIPVIGQSTPVNSPPRTSSPPPSPPRSTMTHMNDDIKLPVFKGTGSKDPKQFSFL